MCVYIHMCVCVCACVCVCVCVYIYLQPPWTGQRPEPLQNPAYSTHQTKMETTFACVKERVCMWVRVRCVFVMCTRERERERERERVGECVYVCLRSCFGTGLQTNQHILSLSSSPSSFVSIHPHPTSPPSLGTPVGNHVQTQFDEKEDREHFLQFREYFDLLGPLCTHTHKCLHQAFRILSGMYTFSLSLSLFHANKQTLFKAHTNTEKHLFEKELKSNGLGLNPKPWRLTSWGRSSNWHTLTKKLPMTNAAPTLCAAYRCKCVCMCVHVCACVCMCVHVCVCVCMHAHAHH